MTPPPPASADSGRPGASRSGAASSWRLLLKGNVGALALASLFNDVASEMVHPLLPLFLVGTLGASATFLGWVEGIAETTGAFLKLASGIVSDRMGKRKGMVAWGYGVAGAVRPLMSVATAPWQVLGIRFTDRVGKGIRSAPRDALLVESVPPGRRGLAFGIHRAADHLGAVLGPLLGALLLALLAGDIRMVFALSAIPGILAVTAVVKGVREVAPEPGNPADGGEWDPRAPGSGREGLLRVPGLLPYLGALLVFTLGNASDAFIVLRAAELGVPLAAIPLLWGLHNVSRMVFNIPGGALADRISPRWIIVAGWTVYALVYGGFAVADEAWQIWALMGVYGLYYGLTESPQKALLSNLAPAGSQGRAFGAYHFVLGIGALPASVLFGWIWQTRGAQAAFGFGAVMAGLGAVLLLTGARARPTSR